MKREESIPPFLRDTFPKEYIGQLPSLLQDIFHPLRERLLTLWPSLPLTTSLSYRKNSAFLNEQWKYFHAPPSRLSIETTDTTHVAPSVHVDLNSIQAFIPQGWTETVDIFFSSGTQQCLSPQYPLSSLEQTLTLALHNTQFERDRWTASYFLCFQNFIALNIRGDLPSSQAIKFFLKNATTSPLNATIVLLSCEERAKASLQLYYLGNDTPTQNQMGHTVLLSEIAPQAHIHMSECLAPGGLSFKQHYARIAQGATLEHFTVTINPEKARFHEDFQLYGSHSQALIKGIFWGKHESELALDLFQRHYAERSHSSSLFKGILQDSAVASFQGLIEVKPEAPYTDAYLDNKNLLLNDGARINAIPMLEIHNNEVRCSHGSTTSQLDTQQLFYLSSRGIPSQEARTILVESFLEEISAILEEEVLAFFKQHLPQTT